MKNKYLRLVAKSLAILITSSLFFVSCKEDKAWSVDNDITWPTPNISALSSMKDSIGHDITLTGNFEKVTEVSIGGAICKVKTATDNPVTSIVVTIPRNIGVSGGKVKVVNVYKKYVFSVDAFAPLFPKTTITKVPASFYIDGDIRLEGTNMDMITSLKIGDSTFVFDGTTDLASLTIKTKGKLAAKDKDVLKVSNIQVKGNLDILHSVDLATNTLTAMPKPLENVGSNAVLLSDFEDGADHWQRWDGSPVWGANTEVHTTAGSAGITPHIYGGSKFATVKISNVKVPLDYAGEIYFVNGTSNYDFSKFRHPYLTFLLNTGANKADFWLEINQGGKFGHGLSVTTNNKWQWVSMPIGPGTAWSWAEVAHDIDYTKIQYVKIGLQTKAIGAGNTLEANIDNVQITEGPMINPSMDPAYTPVVVLKDFEDGVAGFNTGWKADGGWETNGKGTPAINGGGLTAPQGSKYLEMTMDVAVKGWSWDGDINMTINKDIPANSDMYISFWCNTLGKTITFESELGCANGKWGTSFTVKTNGWELKSVPLWVGWSNWGTGAGTYPDITHLSYIKLGMNQDGFDAGSSYKFYLDNIMITNGPVSLK